MMKRVGLPALAGVVCMAFTLPALARNLLQNPHFDGTLDPWVSSFSFYDADHSATADGTGSAVGSVPITNGVGVRASVLQQCVVGIVPGATYSFGGAMRIPPAGAQAGAGLVKLEWHAASDCSDTAIGSKETSPLSNPPGPTETWVTLAGTDVAPAGATSAIVFALVEDDGALPAAAPKIRPEDGVFAFDISIDDLFLSFAANAAVPTLGGAGIAALLVSLAGAAVFLLRR
jgi:hypothetical protein